MKLFDLSEKFVALKEVGYCTTYDALFEPIRHDVRAILELGVNKGGSLLMWREYFPNAVVFGVDINPSPFESVPDRIFTLQESQADTDAIGQFLGNHGADTVDIIIDDAAHIGWLAKASFWPLFDNHLRPGGYYIVEDWGTGYWPDWSDGGPYVDPDTSGEKNGYFPSHDRGMVGFIKQLVDESHRFAIKDVPDRRPSKFKSLLLKEAMAIVHKVS